MSINEANRLSVMRQIDKKNLTLRKASEELGISLRQTKRLRKRYIADGELGLISKHRGKISPNRIDSKLRNAVIKILTASDYLGFGPTLAMEKLQERHGYYLSKETIRTWMTAEGLWKAKERKEPKIYQRRLRRARFGELLQGDGSRHAWFEDRGEKCAIVIFVDDATSRLTVGRFVPVESTEAYLGILEEHMQKYGRPLGLYTDKHSIFRTSREVRTTQYQDTHFGRVLRSLDIELICAHSPQAKGRVERTNGTLQDRLIKEMRLRNISTIEEANRFFPEFIKLYNKKFGKDPRDEEDAHRPLREGDNLERVFARHITKKLSKCLSFQHEGMMYQLHPSCPHRFRHTHVTILQRPGKPILVKSDGIEHPYTQWETDMSKKPKVLDSKELEAYWPTHIHRKPGKHHPWR